MKKILFLTILAFSFSLHAEMTEQLMAIQKQWAVVNYQIQGDDKEKEFEKLAKTISQYTLQHSKDADAFTWKGIVYSTYAGAAGGLGALKIANQAKDAFETALQLNDSALDGSAYTSLGVLYYKMPGWPISFGSDKKAGKFLKKGLNLNPDGIDSNYFYADYLFEEGEYELAKNHLQKALSAQPRSQRPLADQGRQQEIKALLMKVEKKLS